MCLFIGSYKKKRKRKFYYNVEGDDLRIKIYSNCQLTDRECEMLKKAVEDTMKLSLLEYGDKVAKAIVEALQPKIWASKVDGGDSGKDWVVWVSEYSLEFLD